ncbi:MAG: universal stress protein [Gammaproteobacteria bacterium]|nr:universal stress protein [Gammaproteobacteria bacterium]
MYARIMVAIDGSTTSDRALKEAIALTKDQKAQLRLVHVIDQTPIMQADIGWPDNDELEDIFVKSGQRIVDEAVANAAKEGLKVEASVLRESGKRIASVIVDEAKDWSAQLLVVGTHGRHGVERLLLGSVAEGILRAASMPVLLVRGQ